MPEKNTPDHDQSQSDDAVRTLLADITKKCASEAYVFRGTTITHKQVSSSLYCKYRFLFTKYYRPQHKEREIVERAQKTLFPANTSNIEILTELRHFGAMVNLIDFSRNLYVALFFACNGSFENDGLLIMYKPQPELGLADINYLEYPQEPCLVAPAITPTSKSRIEFQSGIYVCAPEGFLEKDITTIVIDKNHKKFLLDHLNEFHNINENNMFNDMVGFIANEEAVFMDSKVYFQKGMKASKKKNYQDAIEHYNQAIELAPDLGSASYYRGHAKNHLRKYAEAIEDFDRVIELSPNFAAAYNDRANAKHNLEMHKEALTDAEKAIELDPDLAAAYYNRGAVKVKLAAHQNWHQDALQDMYHAKALYKKSGDTGAIMDCDDQIQLIWKKHVKIK